MGDDVAGFGLGASAMLRRPSLQGAVDFIGQLANDNLRHVLLHSRRSDIIIVERYHFKDEIWATLRSPDRFPADAQELRYLGQEAQLLVPHPPHLGFLHGG